MPYAFLYDWVPGFSALRVPVRFAALLNLALAVLGGYGLAWLLVQIRRPRRAVLLWVPLLALMTLEYVQVRDLSNHRDMRPPASGPYSYLASHPGPVIELPMYGSDADVWYTYGATYHWQPLVNGFSSFVPPGTVEIAHAMAAFPDPAGLALLQGLEVRHVVVRYSQFPLADQPALRRRIESTPALHQVYAQGSDAVYEIAPDPWASRIAAALPADGYLWVDRGQHERRARARSPGLRAQVPPPARDSPAGAHRSCRRQPDPGLQDVARAALRSPRRCGPGPGG